MLLSLITSAVALFYISAIPIKIALRFSNVHGFGFGIAPFEERYAWHQAEKPLSIGKKKKKLPKLRNILPLLRAGKAFLSHLHPDALRLRCTFSTGDAASTAMFFGGVMAIFQSLQGPTNSILRLNLNPDFSSPKGYIEFSGMIHLRTGHIILAALIAVLKYGNGRFNSWKSTRLKALCLPRWKTSET